MIWMGQKIAQILSSHPQKKHVFERLATHPSDVARCWAAFIIGSYPTLEQQLKLILPFAAEAHFGVRGC